MASLIVEKQPTAEPITLQMAKDFCRVSITDDDALFTVLIQSAREACETFTNRSFCYKGFRQGLDSFPYFVDTVMSQMAYPPSYYSLPRYSTTLWNYSQMIKLFRPPLVSVQSISLLWVTDQQWHDLIPAPALWYPQTAYNIGDIVTDNNANKQRCTTAGTSNADAPQNWNKSLNGSTAETIPDLYGNGTGVIWQNIGPLVTPFTGTGYPPEWQFGPFLTDNMSEPARLFPGPPGGFWPAVLYVPNAVQIHFTAGYSADASLVPASAKMAMLQCVAHWYENREAAMMGNFQELPNHVKMLLWNLRVEDYQPTRG